MRRKIVTLLLAMSLVSMLSVSVMAADAEKISGFYDIGTKQNVTINPFSGNSAVSVTEKNFDSDDALEKVYENSNRLEVTLTGAPANEYYGVVLVDGSGLPTKDTAIYYINQETATDSNVVFNVYPQLPAETTDMTLYISSSKADFSFVSVPMNYAVNADVIVEEDPTPSYKPGDLDNSGIVDATDVILTRRHIVGGYDVNIVEEVADVNKDTVVDVADVVLLRRYIVGGYNVELK